ncbi:cupin domain-containing protein [bacterium]|nr:cupin domain-containing protein [candidate division CSSED10-310 bacterium]
MAHARNIQEIEAQKMLDGVTMRLVIGPEQGAPHFNMRIFDVQPGAATPHHDHWWEHEVYILAGQGVVRDEHGEKPIAPGMAVFVPGGERHQFVNTGAEPLRFMCLVPQEWLENREATPPDSGTAPGCLG